MMYVVVAVGILMLWWTAYLAQRRVVVSRNWLRFDVVFGVVAGVIVSVREGPVQGLVVGLVALPLMVLFSSLRTVHMRYIERKTQAILDGTPGMREAYERGRTPSRRERRAERDGAE
jgi:hypothetical protein